MDIQRSEGNPSCCQRFLDRHWPLANEQQFGWADQSRWQKQHFTLWAEDKGEIVGVAQCWRMGVVGYVRQLLVAREQRGRGVGRMLPEAFELVCADCQTYKESPSEKFYRRRGYKVEAVIEKGIHCIDWVYMCKEPGP